MRKILLSVAIAFGVLSSSYTQEIYPCHTDEKAKEFVDALSPQQKIQYRIDKKAYESETQNFIANNPKLQSNARGAVLYTIPVVFHIIHQDGPENISDEQVKDCIQHMNDDFQKLNTSAAQVVSDFLPIVADAQIEFKLARLDNDGNCTNGITRTYSSATEGGSGTDRENAVYNKQGNWPGDKYINVFVAIDIGGSAGYANYPSDWIGSGMNNGIHVLHNYVGSIGTASSSGAHTLSHEVGHWLNLYHLWGSSNDPELQSNCEIDDEVADTPNTIGWSTCNLSGSTCDGTLDNVENFMEYSYCSKMFTNGQKARMHAALNSSIGGRNNIHTAENLISTGVNLPDVICKALFKSDQQEICPGTSITFKDMSYHGATGWTWSFPGGSPSSSTSQNPTVTYNTPGVYEVSLSATDGSTTKSVTENLFITVLEHSATLPVVESFEDLSTLDGSFWRVEDEGSNEAFSITSSAAYTGSKSVKLNNFGQYSGNIDALVSNPIDLSGITDKTTLSFRYSYRKRSASNNEWLRIFITKDCGEQWIQRKSLAGNTLGSEVQISSWTPTTQDDWITVHMTNITSPYWVDNFRFKFEFESAGGNNLFIDDINIYSGTSADEPPLSTNEFDLIKFFSVYPNPTNGVTNVTFSLENNKNVNVSLVNMMGQTILSDDIQAQTGRNLVTLDTENVQSGIYLVKMNSDGVQQVKRLFIK